MGRPVGGVLSTFPERIKARIQEIRGNEPVGPISILVKLETEYGMDKNELPSRSSIAAYLRQEGLSRCNQRHDSGPGTAAPKSVSDHEVWQLDAKGNGRVDGVGTIALIDTVDVGSGLYAGCFPALMRSEHGNPKGDDYRTALRLAFTEYGMPGGVQTDNASIFRDTNRGSHFPTRLALWLIGLGMDHYLSRVHRPTDQAKVERSHRTLADRTINSNRDFKNWSTFHRHCREERRLLNEKVPRCDGPPPLVSRPGAGHSGRYYHPLKESELIDLDRVRAHLASYTWYRKVHANRIVSIGGVNRHVRGAEPGQEVKVVFGGKDNMFHFFDREQRILDSKPFLELTKEWLMGDIPEIKASEGLQLTLPLFWGDMKVNTTLLDSGLLRHNWT